MWEWLETLLRGGVQAIGGVIFGSLVTWMIQEHRIRKIRKQMALLRQQRQQSQAVLIVSVRDDIEPHVRQHLDKNQLATLPIYRVHRPESFPDDEKEWHRFIEKMKTEAKRLRKECSPAQILLFTNLPVAMGIFLGAILDNGPEVIVHHYFNGIYKPVGSLVHETVKTA
ncbi:MAG: hypothetical protein NZ703_06150 [Gemmataceae bacterium]|nr:hypothetical protein [Gemmataceae bacterium]MCS7270650.1 hypothetical protein [Gemmataceae bacterium]MDW8242815.1 hypothetical protein [Thermogemmata sp.]